MIETVLRCHATDRRQPIKSEEELPNGWVSIPRMTIGTGDGGPRVLEDVHFASYEILGEWANAQQVLTRARTGLRTA
jgi:hypothetical protein